MKKMKKLSAIALVVAMGVGAGLVHDHAGSAQMQTLGRGSYADALVQEFMAKRLMNTLSDPDLDSRSTLLDPPVVQPY